MKCPTCNGTGKFPVLTQICVVCSGEGGLPDDRAENPLCPLCKGSGKYPRFNTVCENCGGYGRLQGSSNQFAAIFVEPGTCRTSHLELEQFFKEIDSDLRICDPYYGKGTLYRLDGLVHCPSIRFLTENPEKSEKDILSRALSEFCRQYGHVEFRRYNTHDVHDRYILASDRLILLGHGLKDIGAKESFVVQLTQDMAGGIMEAVRRSFDERWESAMPLV